MSRMQCKSHKYVNVSKRFNFAHEMSELQLCIYNRNTGRIKMRLDIEVHDKGIAKYLVHGLHDVLWTDSIDEALDALREDLENFNLEEKVDEIDN